MFKINFNNGIDTTIFPFNLINISININKNGSKTEFDNLNIPLNIEPTKHQLIDNKTTLGGWEINKISHINSDINVYLFIEKEKDRSAWNLIAPVIQEKDTNKIYQYGLEYFALEGCGGGIHNTKDMIYLLKELSRKGIQVNIIPKVVANDLIHEFEYADSGVTLSDLIEKSIDLVNYRKGSFEWIYKQYNEIMNEN